MTCLEDARVAVEAGADALGFMFYEPSPRNVSFEQAAAIIRSLPPYVARVGVFVNADKSQVEETLRSCGLDTLQFHGDESPEFCGQFPGVKIVKAFRIRDRESLDKLEAYAAGVDAFLLDSYVPGQPGGTGATFNWDLAVEAKKVGPPIVLAGGLTPDNVGEAIAKVRPYGLDVSSGVEAAPGKKDPEKVKGFLSALRE